MVLRYIFYMIGPTTNVLDQTEMPFKSDEKPRKVERTFPDFDFWRYEVQAIHKER